MTLTLRFAAGSHKGMIREGNEDSGYAGPRLLAIADGMGGQAAGEVASSEVISSLVQLDDDVPGSDLLTSLGVAVQRANDQLRVMVEEDPQLEGMGTTLTALLWTGRRLGLVHVGDSRAYLLRDGALTQITQDHTWVQRLVDEGRITEEEATTHPQRSLLMRALGSAEHVEPDLSIREVRAGDRYLICSDGLSAVVSHQTIEEALADYQGPQETVQRLIELALRGGGPDNITCIVADVFDQDMGDTFSGRLSDTPVIVGAVAENQHLSQHDATGMQTAAGRAAGLGRQAQPPGGSFGPPGSGGGYGGADPEGGYAGYTDDYGMESGGRRRGGRRWLKASLYTALAVIVVGGALYGGYRWTQTQYYVGANKQHVALYRGISQKLAWISLSHVKNDHPEIELKYLPDYQRKQVQDTITEGGLATARTKIQQLSTQASACKKNEQRKQAAQQKEQQASKPPAPGKSGKPSGSPSPSAWTGAAGGVATGEQTAVRTAAHFTVNQSNSTPTPGPTLSEEEQKLVSNCEQQ
ncbi:Stp1/IreP family PP2C-type Ser/Thr phosphatase [Streptomyces montanisoli]|uniref:Serine/threonine protein phosphatase PstP n=1 Tax=Streptomyces montanisoli TaxID=2798581 RepID=A0A940MF85_9ACTN|nr:Stp1/IreP family PP2C-type Ser/Thr phosphatase [Streptomyces montanisoli]MBP0457563.1 Stp1/IreP family PP2C-type Ser/Thr phosphatase [Streptomyces montanisoli]